MFFLNVALRKIGGDNRRLWGISRRKRIWGCGLIGLIFNWLCRNITLAFQRLRVHFPYDPHSPLKIGLKIHEMTCFFTIPLSGFLWHISYKQTDRCFFQSVLTDVPFNRCWQTFLSVSADRCSFQPVLTDVPFNRCWQTFLSVSADRCYFQSVLINAFLNSLINVPFNQH